MRVGIEQFEGLRTDVAGHLVKPGEATGMLNLRTGRGSLRTRPGIEVVSRQTLGENESPAWPVALWARSVVAPTSHGGKNENEVLYADPARPLSVDWTQLGNRLFVVDGASANLVREEDGTVRPMGALPQRVPFAAAVSTGGSLAAQTYYTYGVRRMLRKGGLEIPSAMITAGATTDDAQLTATLSPIAEYEYADLAGDGWTIEYEIFRSQPNVPGMLYRIAVLEDVPEENEWEDDGSDDSPGLDMTVSWTLESDDIMPFPPARFARAWRGRLVLAGARWRTGVLDIDSLDAQAGTMVVDPDLAVTSADVDAQVRVAGIAGHFVVASADAAAGTWTLAGPIPAQVGTAAFSIVHPDDIVYAGPTLPGNIEGYVFGEDMIASRGSGNRVVGLACTTAIFYILRENVIEILDTVEAGESISALPSSPPGAASHRTIADAYSPSVFYYAGRAGVVRVAGGAPEVISDPIRGILETEVDHTRDGDTHAVYDPSTGEYSLWLFRPADATAPSLRLVFDLRQERWHADTLPASASGVWMDATDHPYAVVGILGGVARLAGLASTGGWRRHDGPLDLLVPVASYSAQTRVVGLGDDALKGVDVVGLPLWIAYADGTRDWRLIVAHDDDTATVASAFAVALVAATDYALLGHVPWQWDSAEIDFASRETPPEAIKKVTRLLAMAGGEPFDVRWRLADAADPSRLVEEQLFGEDERHLLRSPQCGFRASRMRLRLSGWGDAEIVRLALDADVVSRQ
jgi:hypothetical protein